MTGDPSDVKLVTRADRLVRQTVSAITSAPFLGQGNNAIVILTEQGADGDTTGCCDAIPGTGRVPVIVINQSRPAWAQGCDAVQPLFAVQLDPEGVRPFLSSNTPATRPMCRPWLHCSRSRLERRRRSNNMKTKIQLALPVALPAPWALGPVPVERST